MSTPPPTETPAPLSTQAQVQADIEVRLRMSLGWSKSRDALCEEAAIEIATLRARNEAHVAALQEIGRGVEEDQATIARLREAMKLIAQCLEGSKYKSNMEGRAYGIASQTVATLSSPAPEGADEISAGTEKE